MSSWVRHLIRYMKHSGINLNQSVQKLNIRTNNSTSEMSTYLFIGRISLHIWVFHELIILLAIRVLVEVFRPNDNNFISKCREWASLGPGATPSIFLLLIVAAWWMRGLFRRRPNARHRDIKSLSVRAKSGSIGLDLWGVLCLLLVRCCNHWRVRLLVCFHFYFL